MRSERTVSHICSLIGLLLISTMRAPNSTPMVRSCTCWKRLSVNWSNKHDFPTPALAQFACSTGSFPRLATPRIAAPVSPMIMYLKRYLRR